MFLFQSIPFSNTILSWLLESLSEWVKSLSRVQLFATPWTVAHQAPPSMGFSRQEYRSGVSLLSPILYCDHDYTLISLMKLSLSEWVKSLSHVRLLVTPWTVAFQAPPSMGFSRQEYWSGLPFPSPGDLPDPGIEPWSPAFQVDTLTSEPPGKSREDSRSP